MVEELEELKEDVKFIQEEKSSLNEKLQATLEDIEKK